MVVIYECNIDIIMDILELKYFCSVHQHSKILQTHMLYNFMDLRYHKCRYKLYYHIIGDNHLNKFYQIPCCFDKYFVLVFCKMRANIHSYHHYSLYHWICYSFCLILLHIVDFDSYKMLQFLFMLQTQVLLWIIN